MIPRRIIQTHRSLSSMPPRDLACMARVATLHPEWDVRFYSDGDCMEFVATRFPRYVELYRWLPRPVMKADLFRILAVWELGGFYLDTDMWLEVPLDDLCSREAVFPLEGELPPDQFERRFPSDFRENETEMQLGNYAFGSRAGHPFLGELVAEIIRRTEHIEAENCWPADVLFATGPDMVSTVKSRGGAATQGIVLLEGEPYCFGSYGVHLMSGTWKK